MLTTKHFGSGRQEAYHTANESQQEGQHEKHTSMIHSLTTLRYGNDDGVTVSLVTRLVLVHHDVYYICYK